METYKTYMWQEQRGEPYFRFQTNDPKIHGKMRRRKDFSLAGVGINAPIWIYTASFYSPQKARQTLTRLTGSTIEKNAAESEFWAKTYPIVYPKHGLETPKTEEAHGTA
tara:strand:+ start:40 stop:366 length:327 start_codon:yes stop_codon:yes gene_type:complete